MNKWECRMGTHRPIRNKEFNFSIYNCAHTTLSVSDFLERKNENTFRIHYSRGRKFWRCNHSKLCTSHSKVRLFWFLLWNTGWCPSVLLVNLLGKIREIPSWILVRLSLKVGSTCPVKAYLIILVKDHMRIKQTLVHPIILMA